MVRGELFRLPAPRSARGHERGARFAVVVQADEFLGLRDERQGGELPPDDHD
jgi:hypothetical protein